MISHRLKFHLLSGEISPGGTMAPILAPFGLDLLRLSKELNALSLERFPRGFPFILRLYLSLPSKAYRLELLPPPLSFYLSQLSPKGAQLSPLDLYNLLCLLSGSAPTPSVARRLLGSLRSRQVRPLLLPLP